MEGLLAEDKKQEPLCFLEQGDNPADQEELHGAAGHLVDYTDADTSLRNSIIS